MSYVLANFINTSLAATAASGLTSITLASSVGLPTLVAGQIMPLVLNDVATGQVFEIVYVTAITGAVCTVTRACEGTTAQNWSLGDYAICAPTAATLTPALVNTYVSVDVSASSDTTLTNTQYSAELINVTGVATTNQNVLVPSVAAQWTFANNTSGAFTRTVKTAAGTGIVVPQGAAMVLYCDGVNVLKAVNSLSPQQTILTSGSGTYATPVGARYLIVKMVGGGSGGAGGGVSAGLGGVGGTTTFGTSLLTCTGGQTQFGSIPYNSGAGGSATINSPAVGIALGGGAGQQGVYQQAGYASAGIGGSSPFGGSGGTYAASAGISAAVNTGSGGGGGSGPLGVSNGGGGGGAAGYIEAFINQPSATYTYSVGAAGIAGIAGSGPVGAAGGSGLIIVTAFF